MWPSVQIGRAARAAVVGALLFPVAVCGVATPAFGAESVATPAERVPASPATALEGLDYLTEEWAPFNYTLHGKPVGISVDILEAALRNAGVAQPKPKVRTVPLAEGLEMAAQGPGKVLFAIVRTPEREPRYQWAGPFTKANFVLYALARRNLAIARPEDLQRYSIGTVTASIENDLLARQGVPSTRVVNRATPGELLRMLEAGEIDLWATGDLAGRHQMRQTANNPNAFEVVHTLSENDLYYVFSRDVPATLVHAFQAALAAVRDRKDEHGVSAYERIIYRNLGVGCARQSFSNDAVVALVDATAAAIAADAAGTLASINNREAPYRDARDPGLYVFVYDLNTTMVAHADNRLVIGVNFHGKGDVEGTPLHDRIRDGALRDGSGWVDYVFLHPVQMNLYYKSAYHRLTRGSDGQSYIVASGNYKRCE